jgi:hypothetical protein
MEWIGGALIILALIAANSGARLLYYKKFGVWPEDATVLEQRGIVQNALDNPIIPVRCERDRALDSRSMGRATDQSGCE